MSYLRRFPRLLPRFPASGYPPQADRGYRLLITTTWLSMHPPLLRHYVAEVHKHMDYERTKVFPYVEAPACGQRPGVFDRRFPPPPRSGQPSSPGEANHHRYYPSKRTNELNGVLFDIFACRHATWPRTTISGPSVYSVSNCWRIRGLPGRCQVGETGRRAAGLREGGR